MASTNQSANTEVIARWLDEAGNSVTEYSFYQLVELLNKLQGKSTTTQETTDEIIRFKSCANIAFPTRDVISVKRIKTGSLSLKSPSWGYTVVSLRYRAIIWMILLGKMPNNNLA